MTDIERIQALEKQVQELRTQISNKRLCNHWLVLGEKVTVGLLEAFKTKQMNPHIAQCKSSISCLVGKAFHKNNVNSLSMEEAKEAELLIDYILTFMKDTREKYEYKDMVSGYERKTE